ncbi:hypothetical protein F2Q68_00016611 [Brassica cretica]|uniref:Uncharacterized protein n=1 Tax=Brassica cretica TaxID=69181 RepID=A0A8S9HMB7_BRACR|nr:hypothetical protein F2Q68_00016611 [Brassica cretica]
MAKTRGGGRVGSRRSSRRTQGSEVQGTSATTLKVNKRSTEKVASPKKNLALMPTRKSSRIKNLAVQDDEVQAVTPEDDEIEDVTPEDDDVAGEDKEDDKEDSEKDGEACLTGHEEQEEDIENKNDDNEKGNEEEALNMEEDELLQYLAHDNHKLPMCLFPFSLINFDWLETASWVGKDSVLQMMKQVVSCLLLAKLCYELNPHVKKPQLVFNPPRAVSHPQAYLGEEDQLRPCRLTRTELNLYSLSRTKLELI